MRYQRTCTQRGCRSPTSRPEFVLCYDHWTRLCEDVIEPIILSVSRAYIGRTCDPERRVRQHALERGLPELQVVYEASCIEDAMVVEQALLERYERMGLALDNGTTASFGGQRQGTNYIYVAYEPKMVRRRRAFGR